MVAANYVIYGVFLPAKGLRCCAINSVKTSICKLIRGILGAKVLLPKYQKAQAGSLPCELGCRGTARRDAPGLGSPWCA